VEVRAVIILLDNNTGVVRIKEIPELPTDQYL
jgi:hypothetical protein